MKLITKLLERRIYNLFYIVDESENVVNMMIKFIKKTNKFLKYKNYDLTKEKCFNYTDCNIILRLDLILANSLIYSLNNFVKYDNIGNLYKEYISKIQENNLTKLYVFHKVLNEMNSHIMTDIFINYRYNSSVMTKTYIKILEIIKSDSNIKKHKSNIMNNYVFDTMNRCIW